MSLGQRVNVGTWPMLSEAGRQFIAGGPGALARICGGRPDLGDWVVTMRSSHNRHGVAVQAACASGGSRSPRAGFDVRTAVC